MIEQLIPATDPVLIFAILLFIALAAPLLSERMKLPGIIGLIVAGIVMGPHGLGVLESGREVQLLGEIGLLYIMFLAGLELDLLQFIHHRRHSIVFGALTFTIPLVLGSLMGHFVLSMNWPAAILLASMFSSHTLLTYPIASKLGLSKQRAVTTTIGGTLITDTAALFVLAVIAASHTGTPGLSIWVRLLVSMAIYVTAVVIILPAAGKWFFRHIASDGVVAFTGILAAVFLCAYSAKAAGFEPIIGAFLAGLVINSLVPENSVLMNRINFVGHSLFIPFFLVSVGMLLNIGLLIVPGETARIAVAMTVAGFVTKYAAALLAGGLLSYKRDEAMLIFGLSVNQAAATLAAVLVGYNIGIFSEPVLTGTVVMILATSLSGSWLTDRYARRIALAEEESPYSPSDAPQRIMVAISNSDTTSELMNFAMLIRKSNSPEPLYPLAVAETGGNTDERIASKEKLLGSAVVKAISADIPAIPATRVATDTVSGIHQASADMRISTIILGWKGRVSSHARTFGGILDHVISSSRQMVLAAHFTLPLNTMKRVVFAVPPLADHQPEIAKAIQAVKNLCHQLSASLVTVSTSPTLESVGKMTDASPPKVQESGVLLSSWDDLLPWLGKSVSAKNDLVILLSVRRGRLAWQPSLNRLPRLIKKQLPEINFVALYPPELHESGHKISAASCPAMLPPNHIQIGINGLSVEETVGRLIRKGLGAPESQIVRLKSYLTDPMELAPGIVMLHGHVPQVSAPTAFMGVSEVGWKLEHTTRDTHILLLLLSPEDASPDVHLKALADLAGPLHTSNAVDSIMRAKSVEEILSVFS